MAESLPDDCQSISELHELHSLHELAQHDSRRAGRIWIQEWAASRTTEVPIYSEFEKKHPEKFRQAFRMSVETFNSLLEKIEPLIAKKDTHFRKAIPAKMRLQVTLRYFASGASYRVLEELFRIPYPTISKIIPETADALWSVLQQDFVKCPETAEEWIQVAKGFEKKWNYPFALGAIDGKHCTVQAFPNSGSEYHNYKGSFSLVLLGVCDAELKYLFIDIGQPGSRSDAGIWADSRLNELLQKELLNLPETPPGNIKYHFVADDAFPLTTRVSKPFPRNSPALSVLEKVYNYRLSRARRTIENAFGHTANVFRVLRGPINLSVKNATSVLKALVALHNYLLTVDKNSYVQAGDLDHENADHTLVPGRWESTGTRNLTNIGRLTGNRSGTSAARDQRLATAKFFLSREGMVPWQFNSALVSREELEAYTIQH